MYRKLFFLIFFTLLFIHSLTSIATAKDFQLTTKNMIIQFDDQTQIMYQWLGTDGASIIEHNRTAQTGIVLNGNLVSNFTFQVDKSHQEKVNDSDFGESLKGIITGIYKDDNVEIEREIQITLPLQFPDVVLIKTLYTNKGNKKVHVEKVFSQRILLNRQLAEPDEKPYNFASFQGGIYKWGSDYSLQWLEPGFYQRNFMGYHGVDSGKLIYQVGGGMPIIDVWGKTMGIAIAHLQKKPAWLALPVKVGEDSRVEMAITEEPDENIGQKEWLESGESYQTVLTAVIFHQLDYHDPLRTYGDLLRARGIAIKETSSPADYDPYWMSWGFKSDFTQAKILKVLPDLKSMGITRANLDAGWYDNYGDWNPINTPGKFPDGEQDMINFVDQVKKAGFRTAIWWFPLAVDPKSKLAKERPELLVQAQDGSFTKEEEQNYQLCPAYEPALLRIDELIERFVDKWGFDGFYVDKIGMSAVPPCFNKTHNHQYPLESFEAVPELFKRIEQTIQKYEDNPFIDVCICATPHSPYNMPYYGISSASDPISPQQMRRRIKVEKAIHGSTYAVGDSYQLPADEWSYTGVQQSFESAVGIGAKMTAQFADLDSAELNVWQKWFHLYSELELSSGEYLNYYDIAFDKPEVHVVRKGKDLYYGMFAGYWPRSQTIELRGLDQDKLYNVYDYAHKRDLGIIKGSEPFINIGFKESLLMKVQIFEDKK
jgi:alpha-galactosidase